MIEPTESESKAELDRLCDALIAIREEIRAIERGELDAEDNPLQQRAAHRRAVVSADDWTHPYSREQAAYPAPWLREHKYWPPVGADRQRLRRPQPGLHLPAARGAGGVDGRCAGSRRNRSSRAPTHRNASMA